MQIAEMIVGACELYAAAGVGFAAAFLPGAIARIDPRVAGAPLMMRVLILPGVVAFWPLFAWRWIGGISEPIERNPHRTKARHREAGR